MTVIYRQIVLLCFIFFSLSVLADTIVKFNEVLPSSDFEAKVFEDFFENTKTDYFTLFMASDSTMTEVRSNQCSDQLLSLIEKYKTPQYLKLKEAKRVKKIYQDIHDELLDKYVEDARFSDIFDTGYYQCVTATMLYSLVFNALDIPFEIREMPETHYTLVETTNPRIGAITYSDSFKSKYIEHLRDNKLISKSEYDLTSTDELFQEHFYKNTTIGLKELAGLQYGNDGIRSFMANEYKAAYLDFEKCYLFNPSKRISFLLEISLALLLYQTGYSSDDYAKYLARMIPFTSKDLSVDMVTADFRNLTQWQLHLDANIDQYNESYTTLLMAISDSALRADISGIYNYEMARSYIIQNKFKEALPFAESAYAINPQNVEAQGIFIQCNMMLIDYGSISEHDFIQLNNVAQKHPDLKTNQLFNQARLEVCLELMSQAFYFGEDIQLGLKYREIFENEYPIRLEAYGLVSPSIVKAYSSGASYYFKKGQYSKARELLNKGLEYVPNNFELKDRLRVLNN